MINNPILILKRDIDEYLQWTISNGYSFSTCGNYQYELNSFLLFITRKQIDWDNIFTLDTLKEFQKDTQTYTGPAIRGLWQYLFGQKRILYAIDPPDPRLPDPYDDYLLDYNQARKVRSSQLVRVRKVFCAFHNYLEGHNIKLFLIRIEQIDAFPAEFFTGFSPNTRGTYRTYIRGFLKYLYSAQCMESVAVIREPSIATRSPSSGCRLGKMLEALWLSFSNTIRSCSSPLVLMVSEKLLFFIPSCGAMFSRAKSSCSRTWSI